MSGKFFSQKTAFAMAFTFAKAGKTVRLGKENGQWIVKVKA